MQVLLESKRVHGSTDAVDHRVNVVTAPLAGIGLLRLQAIPLGPALTLRAFMALAQANVEQMLKAGFIGRELLEELADVCLFHAL